MLEWLLNRKINKLARKPQRRRIFRNWDALQSFLVLFEADEYEDATQIMNLLKKSGKQVSAYGYVAKGDNTDYPRIPCRMLHPKVDYNRFGFPSGSLIKEIRDTSCDIVLDLTLKENRTVKYLMVNSPASLRTGLSKNGSAIYDLSISASTASPGDPPLSVRYLGEQILHYLQTIRMGMQ
jgi:hypothetical protein